MKKMYKSRKAAWIRALRSGKFPQATGTLCALNEKGERLGYCCLGVLIELAIKDGVQIEVKAEPLSGHVVYGRQTGHLPLEVMQWAGLDQANPQLRPEIYADDVKPCDVCGEKHGSSPVQRSISATAANDDALLNFDQIADLIKENL